MELINEKSCESISNTGYYFKLFNFFSILINKNGYKYYVPSVYFLSKEKIMW
jgi:hypothetical protein